LKAEGIGQVEIFRLFSKCQQALDAGDPRYDAVVDTMDLIWGGAWAKGHPLFDQELSEERLKSE
jgi:hypothetical protein